jgi:cytochrome c556
MRKVSMLIGICMIVALALTLIAQSEADLPAIMKEVGPTQQSMRKNIDAKSAADVERDAGKLQGLFTKAAGVFKALKAQDAVDAATNNAMAAADIVKAAKASDFDTVAAKAGTIQKSCKGCHDVHRAEDPPGSKQYKFK